MSNLLQQLENNESILLMYLAGELPDADRAEVEQLLAADGSLRSQLSDLAALHDDVTGVLATADVTGEPRRCEAAVRAVSRAIVAADLKLAAQDDHQPGHRRRVAWWAYPVAAAAMLVIGVVLYNRSGPAAVTPETPNRQVVIVAVPEIAPPAEPENLTQIAADLSGVQGNPRSAFDWTDSDQ